MELATRSDETGVEFIESAFIFRNTHGDLLDYVPKWKTYVPDCRAATKEELRGNDRRHGDSMDHLFGLEIMLWVFVMEIVLEIA